MKVDNVKTEINKEKFKNAFLTATDTMIYMCEARIRLTLSSCRLD